MDRNTTGVIALGGAIVLLIGLIIAVQSGTFGGVGLDLRCQRGRGPLAQGSAWPTTATLRPTTIPCSPSR